MSIQNDWEKRFLKEFVNTHGTHWRPLRGLWVEDVLDFIRKELADARREVIEQIEAIPEKDVRPEITLWLYPKEFCFGYNEALKDVLATLKEETK